MRPTFFRILLLATALGATPWTALAAEEGMSARFHPWGLFDPGAWKTVRVTTETLNEQGELAGINTTDTKTMLVDIDDQGVTLEVLTCMEVAGKRFEADPQTLKQAFHGELVAPNLKIKEPVDGELVIDGKKIACKLLQIDGVIPNGKTTTTVYYSPEVSPYILKRESTTTDAEGKETLSETNVEVTAFDIPMNVLGNIRNGARIQTVHKNPKGVITTLALVLPEVPGGVVSSFTKEVDKEGRLVRRSTLELIDYGDDPDKDHSNLFGRKRPPRHRSKPMPR